MDDAYEPDSMDEVPSVTLERALRQVRDGTVPPEYNKCLVLLLNDEDHAYHVRTYSCGMTYMGHVALMEAHKFTCLQTVFRDSEPPDDSWKGPEQ